MKVEVLRWPEEDDRRQALAGAEQPRLLVVEPDVAPPLTPDRFEDWVRLPVSDRDVTARIQSLEEANSSADALPVLDDDGLLHCHGSWVAVPPVEARLAHLLLERFGAVVNRDDLTRAGWGATSVSRNSLDVHMLRLRRRVTDLSLQIRTVRSRGYILEYAAGS